MLTKNACATCRTAPVFGDNQLGVSVGYIVQFQTVLFFLVVSFEEHMILYQTPELRDVNWVLVALVING